MNRAFIELIIIGCVAILVGFLANIVSPVGIPLFGQWNADRGMVHARGPCEPTTPDANPNEIFDAYLKGTALFVDARIAEDYEEGHIPRAVSFPVGEFDQAYLQFMEQYPPGTDIITYCSGIDCDDSHLLAAHLKQAGYTSVLVYSLGFADWTEHGRPVKEGSEP